MQKVLSIASYQFLPPVMGGQKGIAFFNRHLCRHMPITCVTIPKNAENNHLPEPYEVLPLLSGSVLRYVNVFLFFKLKRLIRERSITHVILEHPYYGWLGYLLKRFTGVKLVVHSHNIEGLRFRDFGKWWWKLLWWYERWVYRITDYNFFITEEDRFYAREEMKVDMNKSTVITYGILQQQSPVLADRQGAKAAVCQLHSIDPNHLVLLYSATLYYGPNLQALDVILKEINPILQTKNIPYTIIVCGSHLPDHYDRLKTYADFNIIYAGFVDDIDLYFRAADIFLNPLSEGGGIKTKLVEALAGSASAVSFQNGAYGVPAGITGGKLKVVPDKDASAFAEAVVAIKDTVDKDIPSDFFDHFYWGNIAARAAAVIKGK